LRRRGVLHPAGAGPPPEPEPPQWAIRDGAADSLVCREDRGRSLGMSSPARIGLPMTDDKPAPPPAPQLPADAPLQDRVVAVLQTVYDPEIPINIYELGLIYGLDINPEGAVHIRMTLTSPACPVAGSLPGE